MSAFAAAAGNYFPSLIIQSLTGCIDTSNQSIIVDANPNASFVIDNGTPTILENVVFNNTSTGTTNWIWDFGDGTAVDTNKNAFHTYLQPGTFTVTLLVLNQFGCTDSTAFDINIANIYPPVVPLAFSPNADGQNDLLFVRGGPFKSLEFKIYNQWGELIFESDDQQIPWDGMKKGAEQPLGVYVYTLKATTLNDLIFEKWGDVSLLR